MISLFKFKLKNNLLDIFQYVLLVYIKNKTNADIILTGSLVRCRIVLSTVEQGDSN